MNPETSPGFKMIMKHTSGSHLYGTNLEGSDHDTTGICLEPISNGIGFTSFESYDKDPKEGDFTIYSLKKYLRLALSGNPTILQSLFVPYSCFTILEGEGINLQNMAQCIISKRAGKAFKGYMQAQKERLLGIRGQKRTRRVELEEKYGFDTKYAMHVVRLGMQGVELLETEKMVLPLYYTEKQHLLDIRLGKFSFKEVLEEIEYLEARLDQAMETSRLPEHPQTEYVEEWMINTYLKFWSSNHETHTSSVLHDLSSPIRGSQGSFSVSFERP